MKKLSYFAAFALILSLIYVTLSVGYFLGQNSAADPYLVTTQRPHIVEEVEAAAGAEDVDTSAVSVAVEEGWPESLLPGEIIDINTASAADLTRLPGIGQNRAEAIVQYRQTNGAFSSVEELLNVYGIGEGIFNGLKAYITV